MANFPLTRISRRIACCRLQCFYCLSVCILLTSLLSDALTVPDEVTVTATRQEQSLAKVSGASVRPDCQPVAPNGRFA